MSSRRRARVTRLYPGFRLGLFPALIAMIVTVRHVGIGPRGSGLGIALLAGLMTLFAVGLPIDLAVHAVAKRRAARHSGSRDVVT